MINLELGLGSAAGRIREEEEEYVSAYQKEKLGAGSPHVHLHFLDILSSSHNMSSSTSCNVFLDQQLGSPLPPGWEQCLDLKSGVLFYKNLSNGSTTHMDPRAASLAMNTSMDHDSSHVTVLSSRTLIQTNVKAAGTPIKDYVADYTESVNGSTIHQGKAHFHEEMLTLDVDLDLRLSSSLHVKSNLSPQPSSSNDSYLLMNSNSSMSCISDAMHGPANYCGSTPYVIPTQPRSGLVSSSSSPSTAIPTRPSSGFVSSSSSPSATSYQRQCDDSDDEDTIIDGVQEDASMKMTTAACMRCFMFVLLSSTKEPMRCPMCGSHASPLHNL